MIKQIFVDMDGTLFDINEQQFFFEYYKAVYKAFAEKGYNGEELANIIVKNGSKVMQENDGTKTNEEAFWGYFCKSSPLSRGIAEDILLNMYATTFGDICNHTIEQVENMQNIISGLKEKGYPIYLTTNSFFPIIAVEKRLDAGGYKKELFEFITTNDASSFVKPNPGYFKEVFKRFNLKPNETFMIGNDMIEDKVIETLGSPCYIIQKENINETVGTVSQLQKIIEKLPNIK